MNPQEEQKDEKIIDPKKANASPEEPKEEKTEGIKVEEPQVERDQKLKSLKMVLKKQKSL